MNMLLKSSTNRKRIRLFHIWTRFDLFWFKFGCAWLWLAEKFLQKWRWFLVIATRLSGKAMCTVTNKQHKCRFLVLKRSIQNVTAGFAFFTVVETSCFIGWNVNTLFISTCWTIHNSDSFPYSLSTYNSLFPYLVDWNGTLSKTCLSGNILAKKKRVLSVFVVSTCSCNLKGTL